MADKIFNVNCGATSTISNNVWEPTVYGWEVVARAHRRSTIEGLIEHD